MTAAGTGYMYSGDLRLAPDCQYLQYEPPSGSCLGFGFSVCPPGGPPGRLARMVVGRCAALLAAGCWPADWRIDGRDGAGHIMKGKQTMESQQKPPDQPSSQAQAQAQVQAQSTSPFFCHTRLNPAGRAAPRAPRHWESLKVAFTVPGPPRPPGTHGRPGTALGGFPE
ncbi:hypothetical protein AB5N19_01118 [Seiridium cardinale]|uniref:Uncharacterized protein n=1 Tax=Seiridium cardinale TaxID=138064 RepID=A0ABR2XZL1_9PEZI